MPRSRKIKEVRATRFILEDPKGNMRGHFEAYPEGVVLLNLFGMGGACLSACIDRDGNPKVNFQNKEGKVVMGLGVSDDIGQGITISDSTGCPVCFVFVGEDDLPRIKLFKKTQSDKGKLFWSSPTPSIRKKKKS